MSPHHLDESQASVRGGGHKKAEIDSDSGQLCQLCGAWRGSFGLEPTPELYVNHAVQIFREVKRVLRSDGTLWLNLGDTYASQPASTGISYRRDRAAVVPRNRNLDGLKPKDLIGIPWRVSDALMQDGWYRRSALPWVKRSAMPESCNDRPASALEYVFLFSKSSKYFFDMEAVRIPHKTQGDKSAHAFGKKSNAGGATKGNKNSFHEGGRNFRNTDIFYESIEPPHGMIFCGDEMVGLDVNPQAFKEAHFATFPEKLVIPMIKAGTSEHGVCGKCGNPWVRVVETSYKKHRPSGGKKSRIERGNRVHDGGFGGWGTFGTNLLKESKTIGWQPTCPHWKWYPASTRASSFVGLPYETVPATVLDPFAGALTVGKVCERLGRRWVAAELSEEYCAIAKDRIEMEARQGKLFHGRT